MEAYFRRLDSHTFEPTAHMSGGWDPEELHFSPLAGLLTHSIQQFASEQAGPPKLLSRISFDILGRLANDECEVRVASVRPGRTIELIEATVSIRGREVVIARAWMLASIDTLKVAGGETPRLPDPTTVSSGGLGIDWPGGFVASLDVRPIGEQAPGRAAMWLTTGIRIVDSEKVDETASFLALVDTANGAAPRENPRRWLFPNVDLTVHLHRQPRDRWVGLDTRVLFGPTGQGVTSTVLHDIHGPVGFAQQTLTIRPAAS